MNLKTLKPAVRKAIAPTIVVTVIFFLTYFVFGAENSMIGPFATLSFLRFRTMHNHYECMIKNYAVFMAMALLAFLAAINLPLFIVINILALFWIAYLLIDEYDPSNYFPMGMALIFFQIAPVTTPAGLSRRILALAATFVIVFLFVFILSGINKKTDPVPDLIRHGFSNCQKQLELCRSLPDDSPEKEEKSEELHRSLRAISLECSGEIYSYNRASLFPRGKTNWYCHFILVFQVINYFSRIHGDKRSLEKAEKLCNDFFLEFCSRTPSPDYRRMNFRLKKPDLRSFRLRFALRQVITVTPCLVFARISGLPNAYWLVISVFFMMIPFTDHTLQRVRQRVLGTMAGIVICLGLFSLFPGFPARIAIMTIANFLIYGANGYGPTVAYITCSALALQSIDTAVIPVLLERLVYTAAGGAIALLANHFIFPIRLKNQCSYLSEMILSLQNEITVLLEVTTPGDENRRFQIDQCIIKSYLIFNRLENMQQTLPEEDRIPGYREFEEQHITFMARCLSKYLLFYNLS